MSPSLNVIVTVIHRGVTGGVTGGAPHERSGAWSHGWGLSSELVATAALVHRVRNQALAPEEPERQGADAGQDRREGQGFRSEGSLSPEGADPAPTTPQVHLGPVEETGEGQELAGERPQPHDDDDVAGTGGGQEREARDDEGGPAD